MKNLFTILFVVLMADLAPAIVVDDYAVATSAPANELSGNWDLNWDYAYNYRKSSAVAVGEYWILTAAHVADDLQHSGTVVVDGVNYYQQEAIFHSAADDPDNADNADLALVRFDKPFPGFYPLYTAGFPGWEWVGQGQNREYVDNRLSCVMVGYGVTGTVYNTYYTLAAYYDPSSGTKRWGTQKIDRTGTRDQTDQYVSTDVGFEMEFDLGETTYEAGVAFYDSGGGSFVKDGETWKLAGINTQILQSDPRGPNTIFAVSVPAYTNWIVQAMANATNDDDSDGIPNDWEYDQSGSTVGVDDAVDQDGDEVNGLDEYVADTDPTDGDDFFEIGGFVVSDDQTVTFDGSTTRKYQLLYTTNDLADPGLTWISNSVPTWGTGANTEIVATNTTDNAFFRIEAILP